MIADPEPVRDIETVVMSDFVAMLDFEELKGIILDLAKEVWNLPNHFPLAQSEIGSTSCMVKQARLFCR